MWGWISDLWGRRPALLMGICGGIFSQLLFGFRLGTYCTAFILLSMLRKGKYYSVIKVYLLSTLIV